MSTPEKTPPKENTTPQQTADNTVQTDDDGLPVVGEEDLQKFSKSFQQKVNKQKAKH